MPSYISSIETAVPANKIPQKDILRFMKRHIPLDEQGQKSLDVLYRASGIEFRHSVIADYGKESPNYTFYSNEESFEPFPDLQSRMVLYEKEAIKLAVTAVENCLASSAISVNEITHLVVVSCTGMYAPGIDIELVEKLGMSTSVARTNINFMGCYAAFNGLKVANEITKNDVNANVIVVCVELCSIHFQRTTDEDNLLSGALFADGSAAVLVQGQRKDHSTALEMSYFNSDLELEAKSAMSWKVGNLGFLMKLSPKVPEVIKLAIKRLTKRLLDRAELADAKIDFYAIHPGGKKILEVIEQELGISKMDNLHAYETLKSYGNMSSATVLFVLKSLMSQLNEADDQKHVISFAFGPGITLESMLLTIKTK
jgi:alpha-pyrone synthase